ncbi:putative D-arabinose 1-dehydrogenase [Xylogone sp. PMI_703]|nr:putative D-arabinose 1-dehydrogenase [Xylogone sp. PMI_703]
MSTTKTDRPPLSTVIPPLICGTATFNVQYNADPYALPTNAIIQRALELGVTGFDTSPYYGPSEELLGAALNTPYIHEHYPRESFTIITKVGRIKSDEFDYSPEWVRQSIKRSLERFQTKYIDLVYCHDVEFVSPAEVLEAVKELRRIRDEDGSIKYVGISGFPVPHLCSLAEMILKETGEPVDAVMSYANYTLQNSTLASLGIERFKKAGVEVVPNASVLGMGILRSAGFPKGSAGDWHPAPRALRDAVEKVARFVESEVGEDGKPERLEVVAIRWALDNWAREAKSVGTSKGIQDQQRVGISVMGVSNIAELEETVRVWESVLDGLDCVSGRETPKEKKEWSLARREKINNLSQ